MDDKSIKRIKNLNLYSALLNIAFQNREISQKLSDAARQTSRSDFGIMLAFNCEAVEDVKTIASDFQYAIKNFKGELEGLMNRMIETLDELRDAIICGDTEPKESGDDNE